MTCKAKHRHTNICSLMNFDEVEEGESKMNDLNENNFKETADKLRNNPSQDDIEKANDLRKKFNEFFNALPQESKDDFMKSVKESK